MSDLLGIALVAFIGGLAVGSATQKHQDDKRDLQRQIWDLRRLAAPVFVPPPAPAKEAVSADPA